MYRQRNRSRSQHIAAVPVPKPSDHPVGSLESRAAARALLDATQKTYRLILSTIGEPLNLQTSTCERQIWPDGSLFEFVSIDGSAKGLTDEQLDAFTSRFPIAKCRLSATVEDDDLDGDDG